MHTILPHESWRSLYRAEADPRSPFYGRSYDGSIAVNTVYNYYIHPYWDEIGSQTLYVKLLYTDYEEGFAVIELFGEWNDCLHNDIMFLRRELTDLLEEEGIRFFILLGEHVLDFHGSDESWYEDWIDNLDEGWVLLLNMREHVVQEMRRSRLNPYLLFGGNFNAFNWRGKSPQQLFKELKNVL